LPAAEPGLQVLDPAADEHVTEGSHPGAPPEMVGADRVIGAVVPVGIRSEAEEVLLRIVAMACPGLEVQVAVREARQRQPRLGRPIPLDAPGAPELEGAGMGEKIAIANSKAIRKAASGGQRAEFWMEPLAVEKKYRLVLGEIHCSFQAVRLIGLDVRGVLFASLTVGLFTRRRFLRR
jgi:hypothetical protein